MKCVWVTPVTGISHIFFGGEHIYWFIIWMLQGLQKKGQMEEMHKMILKEIFNEVWGVSMLTLGTPTPRNISKFSYLETQWNQSFPVVQRLHYLVRHDWLNKWPLVIELNLQPFSLSWGGWNRSQKSHPEVPNRLPATGHFINGRNSHHFGEFKSLGDVCISFF
jgi:hypothetical protein